MNQALCTYVLDLLRRCGPSLPNGVTCGAVLRLVEECMGEDLARFPDGRMLIWAIARHDGYNIPPYPMAGCGDVKEFLSDEGARNVPDWYERHLGIDRDQYEAIYQYELVMVRNRKWWRKVYMVPSATMTRRGEPGGPLLEAIVKWLEFSLGEASDAEDPSLFRR